MDYSSFRNWADATSFHGFVDLKDAWNKLEQVFWIGVLIVSVVLTFWLGRSTIAEFYDQATTVGKLEKAPDGSPGANVSDFQIVYCQQTWLDANKIRKLQVDEYNAVLYAASLIPGADVQLAIRSENDELYFDENNSSAELQNQVMTSFGQNLFPSFNQSQISQEQQWRNLVKFAKSQWSMVDFLSNYAQRVDSPPWSFHQAWTIQFGKLCQVLKPSIVAQKSSTAKSEIDFLVTLPGYFIGTTSITRKKRKASFSFFRRTSSPHVILHGAQSAEESAASGAVSGIFTEINAIDVPAGVDSTADSYVYNVKKLAAFQFRQHVYSIKIDTRKNINTRKSSCIKEEEGPYSATSREKDKCSQVCIQQTADQFTEGTVSACSLRNNFEANTYFEEERPCSYSYFEDKSFGCEILAYLNPNQQFNCTLRYSSYSTTSASATARSTSLNVAKELSLHKQMAGMNSEVSQLWNSSKFLDAVQKCLQDSNCESRQPCTYTDFTIKDVTTSRTGTAVFKDYTVPCYDDMNLETTTTLNTQNATGINNSSTAVENTSINRQKRDLMETQTPPYDYEVADDYSTTEFKSEQRPMRPGNDQSINSTIERNEDNFLDYANYTTEKYDHDDSVLQSDHDSVLQSDHDSFWQSDSDSKMTQPIIAEAMPVGGYEPYGCQLKRENGIVMADDPNKRKVSLHYLKFLVDSRVDLEQERMVELPTLIGNVGGLLGLFVGASVVSFIQLGSFCIGHIHRKVSNTNENVDGESRLSSDLITLDELKAEHNSTVDAESQTSESSTTTRSNQSLLKTWAEITPMHGFPDLFGAQLIVAIIFWSIVMISVIVLAIYQSKSQIQDFANKATQFIESPLDVDWNEEQDLLKIASCPNSWIKAYGYQDNNMVIKDDISRKDLELLMFAVSLIPNADMKGISYVMFDELNYKHFNESNHVKIQKFGNSIRGSLHYDRLRSDLKAKMNNMTLLQFLSSHMATFTVKSAADSEPERIFSHGRLCSQVEPFGLTTLPNSAATSNSSRIGSYEKDNDVEYLTLSAIYLNENAVEMQKDDLVKKFVEFTKEALTPYTAVKSTKDDANFNIATISDLMPTQLLDSKTIARVLTDNLVFYKYKVNVLKIERLNLPNHPCKQVDYRVPTGYLEAKCREGCRVNISKSLKLPCQLGFTNSWDSCSYGYVFSSNVDNSWTSDSESSEYTLFSQREEVRSALEACFEEHCSDIRACTEWDYSFELTTETVIGLDSLGLQDTEVFQKSQLIAFNLEAITLSKETLKVSTVNLLSTIGGLFGFYIGASVISFVQIFMFCGTACFNKFKKNDVTC